MDVYCKHCGEPWDVAELHDIHGQNFNQKRKLFYALGCGAWDLPPTKCSHPVCDEEMAYKASVLQDLLDDDIDGLASMMEDL